MSGEIGKSAPTPIVAQTNTSQGAGRVDVAPSPEARSRFLAATDKAEIQASFRQMGFADSHAQLLA